MVKRAKGIAKGRKGRTRRKGGKGASAKAARKGARKRPTATGRTPASRAVEATAMGDTRRFANGLRSFAIHGQETSADPRRRSAFAAAAAAPAMPLGDVSAETAAQHYLKQSLESSAIPAFSAPAASGVASEFKSLGVEVVPLTDTQTVKFRQHYRKIPVYGSLVTVELDKTNNLVSINSSLGDPVDVDHVARVSPSQVVEAIRKAAGYADGALDVAPRLVYYFDSPASRWRLAYLTEDVLKRTPENRKSVHGLPQLVDYIVDAHSGKIVAELPRTQTAEADVEETNVLDELNQPRSFFCVQDGVMKTLRDRANNVHTHDFQFKDIELDDELLPGQVVPNPPNPWSPGAVSAHANAVAVAQFLKAVFRRNGLDNQGEALIASVNCRYHRHGTDSTQREWRNAAWIGTQMVYGQKKTGAKLRSYAAALDVVAHEIGHGLTDRTARLQYQGMTGALNESYSDIFGIVISNFQQPDVKKWNWQMGEDLTDSGVPLRDLSDPGKFSQPAHMDDYVETAADHGGVHTNSGIHNKAAFNLLTTKAPGGGTLIDPQTVVQLFYLTLTQHLSRTSGFADSRRGMDLSARSLLRNDPDKDRKIAAIGQAFEAVGIRQEQRSWFPVSV